MDKKTNQKCLKTLLELLDSPDVSDQLKAKIAMYLLDKDPADPFESLADFTNDN